MSAPAVMTAELVTAAYGFALRVTQDEDRAVASVESAVRLGAATPAGFLRGVRRAARLRRAVAPDPRTAPRAHALSDVSYPEWAVVERVALRGMSVTEAAAELGLDRREALRLLDRGMLAAGGRPLGVRQPGDDAHSVRHDV